MCRAGIDNVLCLQVDGLTIIARQLLANAVPQASTSFSVDTARASVNVASALFQQVCPYAVLCPWQMSEYWHPVVHVVWLRDQGPDFMLHKSDLRKTNPYPYETGWTDVKAYDE